MIYVQLFLRHKWSVLKREKPKDLENGDLKKLIVSDIIVVNFDSHTITVVL